MRFSGRTAVADHAIRYLKEHGENYPDRPFFQYLAFTEPHFPLQALQEDKQPEKARELADRWSRAVEEIRRVAAGDGATSAPSGS